MVTRTTRLAYAGVALGLLIVAQSSLYGQRGGARPVYRPPPRPVEAPRPFEPGGERPGTLREFEGLGSSETLRKFGYEIAPDGTIRTNKQGRELTPDIVGPLRRTTAALETRIQKLETELTDARGAADRYRQALVDSRLSGLGYVSTYSGVPAVRHGDAVRAFQTAEGLSVDGIVGRKTSAALEAATVRAERLAQLDAQSEATPLTLESHIDRPVPALFVLYGREGLLYRGNDASALRNALHAQVASSSSPVYVDASGYPQDRLAALRSTLQIADAAAGHGPLRFGLIDSARGVESLFRGVQIERVRDIEERSDGFEVTVDLTRDPSYGAPNTSRRNIREPLTLRAWATTRQLLVDFMRIFRGLFHDVAERPTYAGSMADVVHAARLELKRLHGLNDEELAKALHVEFGSVELVLMARDGLLVGE